MAGWIKVEGTLKQVAVGSVAHIWGVQVAGNQIWRFENGTWRNIKGGAVQIDTASDGTTYCIDSGNVLFRFDGENWVRIAGNIKHVGVGSANHVWGVNTSGKAGRIVNNQFVQVGDVTLLSLSVGSDGAVWGVTEAGAIYRYNGSNGFELVKGTIHQIAVGSANSVWGVQSGSGNVWRYNTSLTTESPFEQVPGTLGQISVGADGVVWGTHDGNIYYYCADGPVVVSDFRMVHKYFNPGEDCKFAFNVTNKAFGTTLTNVKLGLMYDHASFKGITPKEPEIVVGEPLPYGIAHNVEFWLVASKDAKVGKYALHGVKVSSATVSFAAGPAPLNSREGGWMAFEVKET